MTTQTREISAPLYLATSTDDAVGEYVRAVPLGLEGYPTEIPVKVGDEVKKFPVAYFEKSAICDGRYYDEKTKQEFEVDDARMDMWVDKFHKMRAAGIEIPMPVDHSDKAEDNRGFALKMRRDGKDLKFTSQVFGEDGALLALRNRCSVKINPNYTDEKKNNWGEVIEEISFTHRPVINGQGTFVPIAASRGEQPDTPTLYLSANPLKENAMPLDFSKLRKAIGAADADADDKVIELAVSKLGEAKPALELSRTQKDTIASLTGERDAAKAQVLELSKNKVEIPADLLTGYADLATQKIDLCLSRGQCTKAQADILKASLKDGDKPAVLMLSKSGPAGTPIDIALKVLELNRSFTGVMTGVQQLPDPNNPANTAGGNALLAAAEAMNPAKK